MHIGRFWLKPIALLALIACTMMFGTTVLAADSIQMMGTVLTVSQQLKTDKSGQHIVLTARLTGSDSQPMSDESISFGEMQSFMGNENLIPLGSGVTNALGTVSFTYVPLVTGTHTVRVFFSGDGNYLGSQSSIVVNVTSVTPPPNGDAPLTLASISCWVLLAVGIVVAVVWILLAAVIVGVRRSISHASR